MQADVKAIQANDIGTWPDWEAHGEEDEYQWFTVTLGVAGTSGGNDFQVAVATARGLKARRYKEKFQGIIVQTFIPHEVEAAIRARVAHVSGEHWQHIVTQLTPTFLWEYEGHP